MKVEHKKVETKIKSLVDILNEVPYITTHSSCQGHFNSKSTPPENDNALVRFHVKLPYKGEFLNLVHAILSANIQHWTDYRIGIYKRWYIVPDELQILQYDRLLEIKLDEAITDDRTKRRVTDEAISTTEKAILQYLESKDFSVL